MEAQKRNLRARKRATLEQAGVPRQTRLCFQVSPSPVPNHPVSSNRPCCSAVARPTTFRGSWRCSIPCSLLPPHLLDHPHDIPLLSCLPSLPLLTLPPSLPVPLTSLSFSPSPSPSPLSLLLCHLLLVRRLFRHPHLFVCSRRQPSLQLQRDAIV